MSDKSEIRQDAEAAYELTQQRLAAAEAASRAAEAAAEAARAAQQGGAQ